MASTFECSRNDVLSNASVLLAAAAVALSGSPWPDMRIDGISPFCSRARPRA